MEHSADKTPTENNAQRRRSLSWGVSLWVVLAVGVAIGYLFSQARTIPGTPVQIVVTATPNPTEPPVAQADQQPTQTQADQQLTQPPAQSNPPATTTTKDSTSALPPTPTVMEFVLSDARHFQGSANAPVTMIEFSDFKWPYCGRFAAESLTRLREEYINTGKVRFVYKHFAILGPESIRAAEASECAAEQGKFWEYHDLVFADQNSTRSSLNADKLTGMAANLGLDTTAFSKCLSSGRYTALVLQQTEVIKKMGVRGTPGFLINGAYIAGAQSFEAFQQVIEEMLTRNSGSIDEPLD